MLIAGMIVGVGVFFRLPNICLVAFIAILIPFYYQTQSLKTTMRFFGAAVVGFAIGVVLNIALICLLHHQETFIASVKHTFDTFLTHTHTHTHGRGHFVVKMPDICYCIRCLFRPYFSVRHFPMELSR